MFSLFGPRHTFVSAVSQKGQRSLCGLSEPARTDAERRAKKFELVLRLSYLSSANPLCTPHRRCFSPKMSLPLFATSTLRVICTSDTHNENPAAHVPDGDIFIHAGDLVDRGSSIDQYAAALEWISNLPHKLKILTAGNGDVELDRGSNRFDPDVLSLFLSEEAKSKGVVYLDRETRVIGHIEQNGQTREIKVYGNPLQPEFSGNRYPFTFHPHPDPAAEGAWETAPGADDGVQIWVTHGPPRHRLDNANVPGFIGCPVQARKVAESKPLLCVFGHFHYNWGVERVRWNGEEFGETEVLTFSEEKKRMEGLNGPLTPRNAFDFSGSVEELGKAEQGKETIFVNAAWMTTRKRQIEERNRPIAITVTL